VHVHTKCLWKQFTFVVKRRRGLEWNFLENNKRIIHWYVIKKTWNNVLKHFFLKIIIYPSSSKRTYRTTLNINWCQDIGVILVAELYLKFIASCQEPIPGFIKLHNTWGTLPKTRICPLDSSLTFIPLNQVQITILLVPQERSLIKNTNNYIL